MAVDALLIGCNYPRTSSELSGCVNDARDWHVQLEPSIEVRSIKRIENGKATKKLGHDAARKLLDRMGPGDWAWLWFSGHGTVEVDAGGDEASGYDQAIVWNDFKLDFDDEFAALLASRRHARENFVFAGLDCCHSRSMHRAITPAVVKRSRSIPMLRCERHARATNHVTTPALPNVILFAGCGDGPAEYSFDAEFNGRPNGAFTYYALRALQALTPGATFADWFQLVGGRRPKGALPTADYPQQPAYQASRAMMQRPIPIL